MKKLFALLIVIALVLHFTQPTSEEFNVYMENYIEKRVTSVNKNQSKLKDILGQVSAKIGGEIVKNLKTETDYYLFTIYEVKLDREVPYKFMGIGKNFLPLQTEEPFK